MHMCSAVVLSWFLFFSLEETVDGKRLPKWRRIDVVCLSSTLARNRVLCSVFFFFYWRFSPGLFANSTHCCLTIAAWKISQWSMIINLIKQNAMRNVNNKDHIVLFAEKLEPEREAFRIRKFRFSIRIWIWDACVASVNTSNVFDQALLPYSQFTKT